MGLILVSTPSIILAGAVLIERVIEEPPTVIILSILTTLVP